MVIDVLPRDGIGDVVSEASPCEKCGLAEFAAETLGPGERPFTSVKIADCGHVGGQIAAFGEGGTRHRRPRSRRRTRRHRFNRLQVDPAG
jgi:hypothetical protein